MFLLYLRWHYIDILREIVRAWRTFLWFGIHFFSVPTLVRTYFSYWKRFYRPYRSRGFDPQEMLKVMGENTFSRIVGAFIRSLILGVAFVVEIFIFAAGALVIAGWIILPALIIAGLLYPFL